MKKQKTYLEQVHRDGAFWNYSMAVVFILFPTLLCIIFGVVPEWKGLFNGLLATLPLYWIVGLIEVITYVPMLGAGGAYLSFVTGNISNLKLPCAIDAMDKANVKASTEEGEIISTIAIAVSSIVTTFIIILGVILIIPLSPILENEVLSPAFNQIVPALFGALAVVFISKNWKIAIAPCVLMLILFIAIPSLSGSVGVLASVGAVFTIGVSRLLYKKGLLGPQGNSDTNETNLNEETDTFDDTVDTEN